MNHSSTAIVCLVLTLVLMVAIRFVSHHMVDESSSSKLPSFIGGLLGSNIFILLLTAISNLEMEIFYENYQSKFFPEVAISLAVGVFAAAAVHRISVTLCLFFSAILLHYTNKISAEKSQRNGGVRQNQAKVVKKKR